MGLGFSSVNGIMFQSFLSCSVVAGKVFVTYEADSEKHVKEIINFVALLRHNGFYTHVRQAVHSKRYLSLSKMYSL